MCGIIGVLFFNKPEGITHAVRRESAIVLITELLQLTQQRGKDATGITTLFNDGDYIGLKIGSPAMEFITGFEKKETEYGGFLDLWRHAEEKDNINAQVFLGHCRKSSVGNYWDNNNNHPIRIGNIVGVHNGTLTNHDKIFENLACKRDGEVDSEAIFRLLSHFTEEGKNPFSKEVIAETAKRLQGTYAVLTYNANNPYQMAAFRDGKPIEMAFIKPLNMMVLASEEKYLKQAIFRLVKQIKIYDTILSNTVHISLSNTEFKMMQDDSMCIFDLTTEIDSKTSITDLYTSEKIERGNKLWSASSTTKVTTYQTNSTNSSNTTKTDNDTKDKSTNSTNLPEKGVARVWNKDAGAFVPANCDVDKDKNIGNVDINVDTSLVTNIDANTTVISDQGDGETLTKSDASPFELSESDSIETMIGVQDAAIHETAIAEKRSDTEFKQHAAVDFRVIKKSPTVLPVAVVESTEIDINIDPEALTAAEEAYKHVARFKDEEDIAVSLQLESARIIDALPIQAFANRLQSFAFKLGFVRGFMAKRGDKSDTTDSIRRFKVVSMGIANTLDSLKMDESAKARELEITFENLLTQRKDLNYDVLKSMYSAGDMRKSLTLARLVQHAQKLFKKNNNKTA